MERIVETEMFERRWGKKPMGFQTYLFYFSTPNGPSDLVFEGTYTSARLEALERAVFLGAYRIQLCL